jgi:hypothetical protein
MAESEDDSNTIDPEFSDSESDCEDLKYHAGEELRDDLLTLKAKGILRSNHACVIAHHATRAGA